VLDILKELPVVKVGVEDLPGLIGKSGMLRLLSFSESGCLIDRHS
jgi:hypothetical protein